MPELGKGKCETWRRPDRNKEVRKFINYAIFRIRVHFRIFLSRISSTIIRNRYHFDMWALLTVALSFYLVRVDTISEDVFGKVANPLAELLRFINVTNVVSLSRIQCAGQCRILHCTIWKHVKTSNLCAIGYLDPKHWRIYPRRDIDGSSSKREFLLIHFKKLYIGYCQGFIVGYTVICHTFISPFSDHNMT